MICILNQFQLDRRQHTIYLIKKYTFVDIYWWLHASKNPSSILCLVFGHICTFLYYNNNNNNIFGLNTSI